MSDETPRLHLAQLVSLQELNAVTWNEVLVHLDALIGLYLSGRFVNTPPAAPQDGDAYLIGSAPTGAWSGYAGKIAACLDGAWRFYTPCTGLTAYVLPTNKLIVFTASGWKDVVPDPVTFSAYTNFDNYIAAGTPTKVQFNNDDVNAAGAFSASANNFTAPAAAIYAFGFSLRFRANAALPTRVVATFFKNGVELERGRAVSGAPVDDVTTYNLSAMVPLAQGDVIDVRVTFITNDGYIKSSQSHFWGYSIP